MSINISIYIYKNKNIITKKLTKKVLNVKRITRIELQSKNNSFFLSVYISKFCSSIKRKATKKETAN